MVLPVLGILAYVLQVQSHRLFAPWYLPASCTLAALLLFLALLQRFSVFRVLLLVPVLLLAAGTWYMLLGSLPPYAGPVAVGQPFPAFTTLRADGTQLTQSDLHGDQHSLLVFFRGRW
jgi:hypothetical protein